MNIIIIKSPRTQNENEETEWYTMDCSQATNNIRINVNHTHLKVYITKQVMKALQRVQGVADR